MKKKTTKAGTKKKTPAKKTATPKRVVKKKSTAASSKKTVTKKRAVKKTTSAKKSTTAKKKSAVTKKKSASKSVTAKKPAAAKKSAASRKKTSSAAKKQAKKKVVATKRARSKKPASRQAGAKKKEMKKEEIQLEEFREMLLSARERITHQVNTLKGESLTRDDEVNPVEDGTDAFDRQFGLLLASSENEALFEIEEALRRIDEGTYGICEACGEKIEPARLRALPFARKCVKCQSEEERRKGQFHRPLMLERF